MKKLIIAASLLLLPAMASASPEIPNLISIEGGALTNTSFAGNTRYNGYGLRYARTLAQGALTARDSLGIEGGAFLYKVIDYWQKGDSFYVLPVSAVAQYGYSVNDVVRPYAYAGVMKNFTRVGVNPDGLSPAPNSTLAAVGVGVAFSFKGIVARTDIGTDLIGGGLAYGF
jgi:opacity protein-like surface antigen